MKKLKKYIKKNYKKIIHSIDIYLLIVFIPSLFLFYWTLFFNNDFLILFAIIGIIWLSYKYKYYRAYHSIFILILIILWSMGIHQSNIGTRITESGCIFPYYNTTHSSSGLLFGFGGKGQYSLRNYYGIFAGQFKGDELKQIRQCQVIEVL